MSDEAKPPIPRVLREGPLEPYVVDTRAPKIPKVWLFGAQRNVIPADLSDDEDELNEHTVHLDEGSITFTMDIRDHFRMTPGDREFLGKLIDLVQEYEDLGDDDDAGDKDA